MFYLRSTTDDAKRVLEGEPAFLLILWGGTAGRGVRSAEG